MKFKQILEAFQDEIDANIYKMVCASCSNCKKAIKDVLDYHDAWEIAYTGLVELIVNAMVDKRALYRVAGILSEVTCYGSFSTILLIE